MVTIDSGPNRIPSTGSSWWCTPLMATLLVRAPTSRKSSAISGCMISPQIVVLAHVGSIRRQEQHHQHRRNGEKDRNGRSNLGKVLLRRPLAANGGGGGRRGVGRRGLPCPRPIQTGAVIPLHAVGAEVGDHRPVGGCAGPVRRHAPRRLELSVQRGRMITAATGGGSMASWCTTAATPLRRRWRPTRSTGWKRQPAAATSPEGTPRGGARRASRLRSWLPS